MGGDRAADHGRIALWAAISTVVTALLFTTNIGGAVSFALGIPERVSQLDRLMSPHTAIAVGMVATVAPYVAWFLLYISHTRRSAALGVISTLTIFAVTGGCLSISNGVHDLEARQGRVPAPGHHAKHGKTRHETPRVVHGEAAPSSTASTTSSSLSPSAKGSEGGTEPTAIAAGCSCTEASAQQAAPEAAPSTSASEPVANASGESEASGTEEAPTSAPSVSVSQTQSQEQRQEGGSTQSQSQSQSQQTTVTY